MILKMMKMTDREIARMEMPIFSLKTNGLFIIVNIGVSDVYQASPGVFSLSKSPALQ